MTNTTKFSQEQSRSSQVLEARSGAQRYSCSSLWRDDLVGLDCKMTGAPGFPVGRQSGAIYCGSWSAVRDSCWSGLTYAEAGIGEILFARVGLGRVAPLQVSPVASSLPSFINLEHVLAIQRGVV